MALQQGSCVAVSLLDSPASGSEALLFSCLVESGRLRSFLVKGRDVVKTLFPRLDVVYWQNPYKLTVTQLLGTLLSSEAGPVNASAAVLPVELLVKLCEASLSYEFLKSFFSMCSEIDPAFSVVETSNAEQKSEASTAVEKVQTLDPATEASADLILSKMREKLVEMRAAPAASYSSSSSMSFQTPVKPSVNLQLLEPNPVLDQWLRGLWSLQLDPQSPGLTSVSERLATVNDFESFSSPETDHGTSGSSIMSSPGSVTDDAGLLIDSRLALHAALRARTSSSSSNNNSSHQRTFTLSLDESGTTKNSHDLSLLWPCVALAEGLGCAPVSAFLLRKVEQIMTKALQRGAAPDGVCCCMGLEDKISPGQTQAQKDALVKALRTHFATHGVPDAPSLARDEPAHSQSFSVSGASPVTDCDVDSPHVLATPFGRFSPPAGDSPLTEGTRTNALAGASRGSPESPSTSFLSHDSLDGATPLQSPPLPHSRPQYPLLPASQRDGVARPDAMTLTQSRAQAQAEADADRQQRDAVFDRSESEADEEEDEEGEVEKEGHNDGSPVLRPIRCDVEPTQRRTTPFASASSFSSSSPTQRPTSRSLSRSQPDAASESQSQSQSSFRDDSLSRSLAVMRCQPFLREKRAQQAAKETEAALRASRLKSVELAQRSARLGWGKAGSPRRLPATHRSPVGLNRSSTSFDVGQQQSRISSSAFASAFASASAARLDADVDLLEEEAGLSSEAKAAQRRAAQRVRERSRQLLTQTQREQQDKQRRDAAVWGERDRRIKLFMERQKGGRLYLMSMGSSASSAGSGGGGYSSRYQGANSSSPSSYSNSNGNNNVAAHQQEYPSDDDDDDDDGGEDGLQGWGWNGEQEQHAPLVALHSRKPWTVGSPVPASAPDAALAERIDDDNGVFVLRAPAAAAGPGVGAGDGWSSVSLDGECEELSELPPPPPPPISSVSITVLRARDLTEGLGGCNPYVLLDWAYLGRRSTEPFVSPSAGLRCETNPVFGSKLLFKPPFLWSGEGTGGEGSLFELDKELEGREVFITTPSKRGQGQGTVTTAATLCAPVLRVFVYSRNVSVSDELLGEGEVDVDTMMCACQNGLPFSVELFDTVGHRQYAGTVDLCFEL